jgi:hypothetical protein
MVSASSEMAIAQSKLNGAVCDRRWLNVDSMYAAAALRGGIAARWSGTSGCCAANPSHTMDSGVLAIALLLNEVTAPGEDHVGSIWRLLESACCTSFCLDASVRVSTADLRAETSALDHSGHATGSIMRTAIYGSTVPVIHACSTPVNACKTDLCFSKFSSPSGYFNAARRFNANKDSHNDVSSCPSNNGINKLDMGKVDGIMVGAAAGFDTIPALAPAGTKGAAEATTAESAIAQINRKSYMLTG